MRAVQVRAFVGLLAGVLSLGSCRRAAAPVASAPVDAGTLHRAVQHLTDLIVYDIFSPPQASRAYAYSSIAAYEVLRQGGDATYRSLAGQVSGLTPLPALPSGGPVSLPIAGVHAFMTVGRALTFSQQRMDSLRLALDEEMQGSGVSAAVFARSVAYGDSAARHILSWAGTDRFKESRGLPKYSVTREPGRWIPTPPAYMDAVEPNWYTLRPMVMDSARQFRPEPPYPFVPRKGSPFFQELEEVYAVGKALTTEQRAIAAFWDCNPYVMHVQGHTMFATKKVSPGGHWMGIVSIASRQAGADMVRSAEAYARTAIALSEGFLSAWDTKYATNVVRPETMINQYLDPAWEPLLQTPPFPEYTSGHSVISTAAATVLTDLFGDGFAFADSTEVLFGLPVRAFASFHAAASEASISRLYGGIHYRRAIEQGRLQGRRVGELVVLRVRTRSGAVLALGTGLARSSPR